jgi:hypothetical protein
MRSDVQSSDTHDIRERENMHQNRIQPRNAKTLLRLLIGIRMARLSLFAAVALGIVASVSPEPIHAQEYSWCLSREGYLYCFYKTQEQCQWTASGIGGCALNPRLLFQSSRAILTRASSVQRAVEPGELDLT